MSGGASADATGTSGGLEIGHLPAAWTPTPVRPRLPIGVAFVSVLIGLIGFIMVLAAVLFVFGQLLGAAVPTSLEIFSAVDLFGALILIIVGAALLSIATSLWRQETWALWTTIVLVFGMTAYLFFTGFITILFVLFVALLVYLLAVRRYFY
jgi:hypothetical protein